MSRAAASAPPVSLSPLDREIINRWQGGFPIAPSPFARAAEAMASDEATLLLRLGRLLETGALSRFGPLYNAERMGGAVSLAAMKLPPERLESLAEQVNAFPEVAHNYAREHPFNLWFVLAVDHPPRLAAVAAEIARQTGFPVHLMPKEREFRLGFGVRVSGEGEGIPETSFHPMPDLAPVPPEGELALDELDRRLIAATQEGLPLTPEPYRTIGEGIGTAEAEVMARLNRMVDSGAIRRLGVIPNHVRLGLSVNGMSVWDAPDEAAADCGQALAELPFVSHCYQRPRHLPEWPFNLFAMLHGTSREAVEIQAARLAERLGGRCRGYRILYTTRLLKKTGLRTAFHG
ncbi:MAG: AsnC family transcriptional regulator [Magnetococcales bacterium]|nr:AsnC family transcriptional regulator [Magnetococcales bacterium]